jgi:hypothetical protein
MPDDNAALGSRNSPVRPRRNGAEEADFSSVCRGHQVGSAISNIP